MTIMMTPVVTMEDSTAYKAKMKQSGLVMAVLIVISGACASKSNDLAEKLKSEQ